MTHGSKKKAREKLENIFNWIMTTQHELRFGDESKATLTGKFVALNVFFVVVVGCAMQQEGS